jgi:hypothetical protein
MNPPLRLAAGLSCLGVLALGVVLLDPACPLRSPPQGDSTVRSSLAEELQRVEQLDEGEDVRHRCREAKRHVAEQVVAGRCNLAEALDAFRALDGRWLPDHTQQYVLQDLGISEDQWRGRSVLFYVRQVLSDRPDEAAVVVGRLQKQLQQLLAGRKTPPPAPAEGSRGTVRRQP